MSKQAATRDYRQTLRQDVAETARSVIAGTVGSVEAARRLVGIAAELDTLDEPAFRFFLDLDSQSDHFPLGPAREHWSQAALEREDRKRRELEERTRDEAVSHSRSLLAKYSTGA